MSRKPSRTVHALPEPLRDVAWAVGYSTVFRIYVGVGLLAGLTAFLDDWKDTREQLKRSRGRTTTKPEDHDE